MGNVELIELKNSRIQCPSCLHHVFKASILCACGKHIRPDQEMIRRIKAAFEILRAPYIRASVLNSRGFKHGPDSRLEHHHKANDALHGCSKKTRQYASILDRWQNDKTYRESHFASGWSDASVRYLDHIAQIDISQKGTQEQRSRCHNLLYLQSVDEDRQAPPLSTRPGNQKTQNASVEMQRQSRQDLGIPFIPKSQKHLGNQLALQGYLTEQVRTGPRTSQKTANRQPHLLFSVVFNILVETTVMVFELARMASTQLAG